MDADADAVVADLKRLVHDGQLDELRSYMVSPPEAFQDKMNCLFVALFHGVGYGFSNRVFEKKDILEKATYDEPNCTKRSMVLLRAVDFFCQTAEPDAVKEVPWILKYFHFYRIVKKYHIREWHQQGLNGPTKDSQIWEGSNKYIRHLEVTSPRTDDEIRMPEDY